jgi:hypothetical protein
MSKEYEFRLRVVQPEIFLNHTELCSWTLCHLIHKKFDKYLSNQIY